MTTPARPVIPFVARPPRRHGDDANMSSERPGREVSPLSAASRHEAGLRFPGLSDPDLASTRPAASALSLPGVDFGPLAPLVADDAITDVFVNGDGSVWLDRGAGVEPRDELGLPPPIARELATRLIAAGGRHVDEATPCVDVRLGRGIRVHVILPPVSLAGTLISIRLPRREPIDFDRLDSDGYFDLVGADNVRDLVVRRRNVLVTGAGGSGKTTLLAAMLGRAARSERIILIEDVAELRVDHPHVVSLEARQANLEGAGAVGLDRLVREALRMRPDRLVVGECRGPELRELLAALNTGHDGGAGTLHANSLDDVPARLEALASTVGMAPEALARQAVSAFHAIAHVERTRHGRRLAALGHLALGDGGRLSVEPL